jgi:hypothetical protein
MPSINREASTLKSPIGNPIVNPQSAIANSIGNLQSAIGNRSLGFPMRRVFAAEPAILRKLEPLARLLLVLGRAVVTTLALVARQGNDVAHC